MVPEVPLAVDTDLAAERMQFAIWRRMSPAEKFATFLDLQETAVALAETGIRLRCPHASDREVFLRRVARTLDAATMERVYGWAPDRSA